MLQLLKYPDQFSQDHSKNLLLTSPCNFNPIQIGFSFYFYLWYYFFRAYTVDMDCFTLLLIVT